MRHRRKINHLSRKSAHRKSMLANMASSLILHKRIHTTVAKAKALRTYVEPLITKSKHSVTTKTSVEEASHLRRVVFSYLQNKEAVTELFREVSSKVAERPGGYTRIIKTGTRLGDNAEMCMMELVDYNEHLLEEKAASETKSKRRRRGGKKKTEETSAGTAAAAAGAVASEAKTEQVEEPAADIENEEDVKETEEVEAKTDEVPEAKTEETPEKETEDSPGEKKDNDEDAEKKASG